MMDTFKIFKNCSEFSNGMVVIYHFLEPRRVNLGEKTHDIMVFVLKHYS
jgi:hypothetical protein